jgi:hypothetical protein
MSTDSGAEQPESDGPVYTMAGEIAPPERDQLLIELSASIGIMGETRCANGATTVTVAPAVLRQCIRTMRHALAFVKAAS